MWVRFKRWGMKRQRGGVVVYTAISLTFILGFAALAVDIGTLYSAQAELQRAADAAALAAASQLASGALSQMETEAILAAQEAVARNDVYNAQMEIDQNTDIEFGKAVYDPATGRFSFQPGGEVIDAVRVTVRRDDTSAAGPIRLAFGRMFGQPTKGLVARATAVLVPRDIAVVIDLSNSMCHDSQTRYYDRSDGGYSNLRDVWAALDGPEPSRPYIPGPETTTEYASDTGPTFGQMDTWGDPLLPNSYNAANDPGLFKIQRYATVNNADLRSRTLARGYSNDEVDVLMSGVRDGSFSHWRNRTLVLLGLVEWKSGRPGGKYAGGDGDSYVDSSELFNWLPKPSWRVSTWTWSGYVSWVGYTGLYRYIRPEFRWRYGLKTFTDYLIEGHPQFDRNNNLWATPEEPLRAIKDAVQSMIDVIVAQDSLDHVSLEIFATTAKHEVDLTDDLQLIPETLYRRQSGHYDRATNIAGGLAQAINELTGPNARPNAAKVIMLMSDGVANTDEQGNWLGDGSEVARQLALDRAQQAADLGMTIYTVSVGYDVDRPLLQQIAEIGRGQEFYAVGNPEEYSQQLEDIFRTLGGKRPVALIE